MTVGATSSSPTAPASTTPIMFTSLTPSVCSWGGLFGGSVNFVAPGTCTIAANQAGNGLYNAAPQATLDFAVGAALPSPTTFLVTNNNDSGAGSLRDAISQANAMPGFNAISFFGVTGTITLTSGQIQISGPLLITGPGADQLAINGNVNSRIFAIFATDPACPALDGPDYLVSISGLRLTNARRNVANSNGGAIFTEHSLALDSMLIDHNAALGGGGVMFAVQYPGQSLSISNSRFLNNFATELLPATVNATNGSEWRCPVCRRKVPERNGHAAHEPRVRHHRGQRIPEQRLAADGRIWSWWRNSLVQPRRHLDDGHGHRRQSSRSTQSAGSWQDL